MIDSPLVRKLVALAIEEDLSFGDITANLCIPQNHKSTAAIVAREELAYCGSPILDIIRTEGHWNFSIEIKLAEGGSAAPNQVLAVFEGRTRELLSAERTVLNFLQRMCGVATFTRSFISEVGKKLIVLDTRKTMPGWRVLDKYAVKIGGAKNHRLSLGDMVLVKNNHIDAHPQGIRAALSHLISEKPPYMSWEVEVRNLEELRVALDFSPTIIMLDNFSDDLIKEAMSVVNSCGSRPMIEVSGGITKDRAKILADFGIDAVSSGSLTTAAPNVDISMRISTSE